MNHADLKRHFPNASRAVLAANREIRAAEPAEQAPALAGDGEGKAQGARRPHVCFVLRRVSLFDTDAKWGAVKDLLDALQYAGAIPGDREEEITLEVLQEKVGHFADEKTEIVITYL